MKSNEIKLLDKSELKKSNDSIVGMKYNKITTGLHKGLYEATAIVNPEGISMSIWTKEQSKDLDKRFGEVNSRIDGVETRLDRVEMRLDRVETRLDKLDIKVDKLRDDMFNLFKINGFKVK